MPRAVLQPAANQAAPVSTPVAPATPKPVATAQPSDPYAALAAQLRALGLTEEGIQQAVAQKRAADQKGKPAKVADPIEDPEVLDPEPAPAPAAKAPEPKSQADIDRQMVADLQAANKAKRTTKPVEAPAVAPVSIPAPAPAPVVTPAAEPEFAAQMADADEDEQPAEIVPAAPTEVAIVNPWTVASGGAISGEFDASRLRMPQLKIMQGSGEEMANYSQGELVFCDEKVFNPPTADKPSPVMRCVVCKIDLYYRENPPKIAPGQPRPTPRNARTEAEVARMGGTVKWTNASDGTRVKPSWGEAARVVLLIEQPKDNPHPGFALPVEVEGGETTNWAAAVYFTHGEAYRQFTQRVLDCTTFMLREGDKIVLSKRIFKMQVVKIPSGDFQVFAPKATILNVLTPDSLRQMAANLVSSGNQPNQ